MKSPKKITSNMEDYQYAEHRRFQGLYPFIAPILGFPKEPSFSPTSVSLEIISKQFGEDKKIAFSYYYYPKDIIWAEFVKETLLENPFFYKAYLDTEYSETKGVSIEWFVFDLSGHEEVWAALTAGDVSEFPDSVKQKILEFHRDDLTRWHFVDVRLNPERNYSSYADFLAISEKELRAGKRTSDYFKIDGFSAPFDVVTANGNDEPLDDINYLKLVASKGDTLPYMHSLRFEQAIYQKY